VTLGLALAGWLGVAAAAPAAAEDAVGGQPGEGPFKPDWQSLKAHQDPAWFRDAKFGIYTHWGPVTVGSEDCPVYGQWYGSSMYKTNDPVFEYHRKTFGDQSTFGYKDLIPRFKAEKFNAEEWADLFAKSGAKFAGPVAVHHDNFAMWDSAVTPWNAARLGPKRDVVGELAKAYKARGLKFVPTFHHGYAWRYFEPSFQFDGADGKNFQLYTEPHGAKDPPSKRFQDQWLAMVMEVARKYEPDMIWFDFELNAVITPEYQRLMFADYYNWAAAQHRESAVAHKFTSIQQYTGILDFERGREDRLAPYPWLTDTALAEWFNQKSAPYRSTDYFIEVLADIVAKNGCMLLDVSPTAEGAIPDPARKILLEMGDWLRLNGEAIYGTRPWLAYGEGPTKGKKGGFSEQADKGFTSRDIRFTTKGKTLYAIALGWPGDGKLWIRSLAADAGRITAVKMLGHEGALSWKQGEQGLEISLPERKPCEHAYVFKFDDPDLKPSAVVLTPDTTEPGSDGSVTLWPMMAELHGSPVKVEEQKIAVQNQQGHDFIACWDNPEEWVSWKIKFPAPGAYEATVIYSAEYADTDFALELAGRKWEATAKKTPSWFDYGKVTVPKVIVERAGVAELRARASDKARWRAMNIREVRLTPSR